MGRIMPDFALRFFEALSMVRKEVLDRHCGHHSLRRHCPVHFHAGLAQLAYRQPGSLQPPPSDCAFPGSHMCCSRAQFSWPLHKSCEVRVIRLLRLLKLFRLLRASRIMKRWQENITIPYAAQSLCKYSMIVLMTGHLMACSFGIAETMEEEKVFAAAEKPSCLLCL